MAKQTTSQFQQMIRESENQTEYYNEQVRSVGAVGVSSKSKWAIFFICLFFGEFGIHCVFADRYGRAFAMFLVGACSGFVLSAIWAIVDLINILRGTFKDGQGNLIVR